MRLGVEPSYLLPEDVRQLMEDRLAARRVNWTRSLATVYEPGTAVDNIFDSILKTVLGTMAGGPYEDLPAAVQHSVWMRLGVVAEHIDTLRLHMQLKIRRQVILGYDPEVQNFLQALKAQDYACRYDMRILTGWSQLSEDQINGLWNGTMRFVSHQARQDFQDRLTKADRDENIMFDRQAVVHRWPAVFRAFLERQTIFDKHRPPMTSTSADSGWVLSNFRRFLHRWTERKEIPRKEKLVAMLVSWLIRWLQRQEAARVRR